MRPFHTPDELRVSPARYEFHAARKFAPIPGEDHRVVILPNGLGEFVQLPTDGLVVPLRLAEFDRVNPEVIAWLLVGLVSYKSTDSYACAGGSRGGMSESGESATKSRRKHR